MGFMVILLGAGCLSVEGVDVAVSMPSQAAEGEQFDTLVTIVNNNTD